MAVETLTENPKERFSWKSGIAAVFCCLLWGSAFPGIKIGYRLFAVASEDIGTQILFAGFRFALAGVLVLIFGSFKERRFLRVKRENVRKVLILGLFQTVLQYMLFYIGLAHASGVKASIIEGANVFMAILTASLVFRMEKLNLKKAAGCLVGFLGVILVNVGGNGLDTQMSFLGEGLVLLSTVAYAISSVLIKRYSQDENPVALSGWQFLSGGLFLMVCGLLAGGKLRPESAGAGGILLYLAFVSAAAYTIWGILLKSCPVSQVSIFGFMTPVFGVLLSAVFLKEQDQAFGVKGMAALALVCIGIFMVNKNTADYRIEE
ncbi:MAG: DMT family transporter [Lachnospiraceae bacterium]|nr:DMT family transporter [Lachnospiraceae bacterium]